MKELSLLLAAVLLAPTLAFADASTDAVAETAAIAQADASTLDGDLQLVGRNEEYGFFEKYFPFTLDIRHDATDDAKVGIWIASIFLPFGWLWAPYVFADEKPGSDFLTDAIITVLIHAAPILLLFIPFVNVFIAIPMVIYIWANLLYLLPVAIINAYDRSLDDGGGRKRRKKKRRKRRRRRESSLMKEMPAFAVNADAAAFAY